MLQLPQLEEAFDAGMVGVYSNGPNMIYPIGTTGQMLNDTYGFSLSMMVGMDEFTSNC